MMGFSDIFQKTLPWIATAVGIPGLRPLAAAAVGRVLGVDVKADSILETITAATAKNPELMLELKKADQDFELQIKKLGLDSLEHLEAIAASDRANARARQIAVRDKIPAFLAIITTVGFFGLIAGIMFRELPLNARDVLLPMVGTLGTAWVGIMTYHFGSSAGSRAKTDAMLNTGDK